VVKGFLPSLVFKLTLCGLLTLLIAVVSPAAASAQPSGLSVTVMRGAENLVLLTVTNATGAAITAVKAVALSDEQEVGSHVFGDIAAQAERSAAVRVAGPSASPVSEALYLRIEYTARGAQNSRYVAFPTEVFPAATSIPSPAVVQYASLIAAALSFVGVALGAALLHWFTSRRENRQRRAEWSKYQHQQHDAAYRRFLTDWNGVPSSTILTPRFAELERSAPIVSDVRTAYIAAQTELDTPNSANKKETCQTLQFAVDRVLASADPWPESRRK
jgi:hypothetical protein